MNFWKAIFEKFFQKIVMESNSSPERQTFSPSIAAARNRYVPACYTNPPPFHLFSHKFQDFNKVPRLLYYSCWYWYCKSRLSPDHTLLCKFCGLRYCSEHDLPRKHKCTAPSQASYPTRNARRSSRTYISFPAIQEELDEFENITVQEIAEMEEATKPVASTSDEGAVKNLIEDAMKEEPKVVEPEEPLAEVLDPDEDLPELLRQILRDAMLEEKELDEQARGAVPKRKEYREMAGTSAASKETPKDPKARGKRTAKSGRARRKGKKVRRSLKF